MVTAAAAAERVFLKLARVTFVGSSMMVSFGGGFVFSSAEGGTGSTCIGSVSDGKDWLLLLAGSDAAVAFGGASIEVDGFNPFGVLGTSTVVVDFEAF